jgi:nucleoside-diphosphate-sugar epimerase
MPNPVTHLITGATGRLGSMVALELAERHPDHHLMLAVRPQSPTAKGTPTWRATEHLGHAAFIHQRPMIRPLRMSVLEADLNDPGIRRHLRIGRPVDYVWHCAGTPHTSDTPDMTPSFHLMNLVENLRPRRMVLVSNLHAVPPGHPEAKADQPMADGGWHYGKWRIENAAHGGYGFPIVTIRPGTLIGNLANGAMTGTPLWWKALHDTTLLGTPDGPVTVAADPDQYIHPVTVDEAARQTVTLGMYGTDGATYHVTPAQGITVSDLYHRAGRALGYEVEVKPRAPLTPHHAALAALIYAFRPADPTPVRAAAFAVTGDRTPCTPYILERSFRWALRACQPAPTPQDAQ